MTGRPADPVQLWLVTDRQPGAPASPALLGVLDAEERLRADGYRSADDRRRFVLAHGATRLIVARYLGAPAAALRWDHGPHGKPELTGRWTGAQVNLSHSDEVSMVALTASRRIGVDVQRIVPRLDAAAMAHRYFPPDEARFVRAAADPERRAERFARLWARKEALVKAHGGRLTQGLRIPVHGPENSPVRTPAHGSDHPDDAWSHDYRIADVPAPPGYRAAVALSGRAGYRLAWRRWSTDRGD
ncbi:4'-phosphopantetheinyl transferase family protein [Streptacidiphilus cavernicola]|uniref:4'-phosphopantetheinyl transferase superfamily protein n=1 Tax=Streptacidiphilus cavernicola TaxID=3342716 RepID=A0ABV6VPM7_9ACTN